MSKELDDAYFRSTPCTHHEPLLRKLVDCVDLLEERIKGLLGATVYVGETNTLPAGSEATASASKRGYDTVLNFGIPKGDKGDPGKDGSDAAATDVRIAGKSITENGIANVPIASLDKYGAVKSGSAADGVYVDSNGVIKLQIAGINQINNRSARYQPINPSFLDYAVKAAMCDGKGAAWTAAEKLAARERIGLGGDFELIEEITLAEDISSIARNATPSGKPYSFDSVAVLVDSGSASVKTSANGWIRLNYRKPAEKWGYISADNFITKTADSFIGIFRKNDFGGHDSISYANYLNSITSTLYFNNVCGIPSEIYRTDFGKVEDIYLYTTGGDIIPAGTKISIYGVWE